MLWKCLVITPFGRLNCKYCLHLVTLGFVAIIRRKCFQVFNLVYRMSNSVAWTSKSASRHCLRIHLDCLETSKSNLFGPQDCLKRCRGGPWGKLIHPLGILLAPIICLSWESVVSMVNSCGRSGPKKEGWWHRFWMHLNPILIGYSPPPYQLVVSLPIGSAFASSDFDE